MNILQFTSAIALAASIAMPVVAQQTIEEKMETVKPMTEVKGKHLGSLDCEIEGGWGMFVGSSKAVTCQFENRDGSVEKYSGTMDKLGLDIGKTEKSYMTWIVFTTAENKPGERALAGEYFGVSGGASLGIGLGANALVGGSEKQIGLQPLSVEGVKGVNLALGLAALKLEAVE